MITISPEDLSFTLWERTVLTSQTWNIWVIWKKKLQSKSWVTIKNIKKLSLRCSFYGSPGVLLLITGLQNFETLNISHSKVLDMIPDRREVVTMDNIVQAVTEKRLKFICYSVNNCAVCKSRPRFDTFWSYVSKHWRDDEIKEFQFWDFEKLFQCSLTVYLFLFHNQHLILHMWLLLL